MLWNPKHGLYHNKIIKHDVWVSIGEIMQCSSEEAKKRMEGMLASCRREKFKGKKNLLVPLKVNYTIVPNEISDIFFKQCLYQVGTKCTYPNGVLSNGLFIRERLTNGNINFFRG